MSEPRDAENWAKPIDEFKVGEVVEGAVTGNVEGRKPTGPLQGFGQLWQKTYEAVIPGPTPEEVISTWKEHFGDFWYGTTVARIHLLVRANDPLYEASFRIYTSQLEDKIWNHTLTQVGAHFGTSEPISATVDLVDKRRQWSQFGNLWKNSAVRTLLRQDRRG
jgi:hypothetical protein